MSHRLYGFMVKLDPIRSLSPEKYFLNPVNVCHKQYEAMRAFFCEKKSADIVAQEHGYTQSALYSLARDFRKSLKQGMSEDIFFRVNKVGRKEKDQSGDLEGLIVKLRKQYLSVPEIKSVLDAKKFSVSESYVFSIIKKEGFARLPRREAKSRMGSQSGLTEVIEAPKSMSLTFESDEIFNSQSVGVLCLIPFIRKYGLDTLIERSSYPGTKVISKLSSILSFLCLKLNNIRRYSADDLWCMDRGNGLFANLNVLPKAAWFSSYSHRVTRAMNLDFLKQLHNVWKKNGFLSDTMNLDFTTIPYWGDDDHLENNWSGKRHISLGSMLAVLAQDPDTGIIDYGDTNIRHDGSNEVVLEFLDFYRKGNKKDKNLRYLVFDSKFTTYANLRKLEDQNIKFITIRRRGKSVVEKLEALPSNQWKKIHVMNANGKGRAIKVYEEQVYLKDYDKLIRQIAITGHGKIKPALIITNDFEISMQAVVRKYSRRWIVEKEISEQIDFFHLNRVSSSMVIKVDFDFTMTILAHNLYRIFASGLTGYSHKTDQAIYEKFLCNSGEVKIFKKEIRVILKKKRNLPALLTVLQEIGDQRIPWLGDRSLVIEAGSSS